MLIGGHPTTHHAPHPNEVGGGVPWVWGSGSWAISVNHVGVIISYLVRPIPKVVVGPICRDGKAGQPTLPKMGWGGLNLTGGLKVPTRPRRDVGLTRHQLKTFKNI